MANELFDQTATFGQPQRRAAATPFRAPAAAPANPDATRGEGLLTKYRPVGGWAGDKENLALAGNAGAGLGEPTSFRGGAGAPEAVPVTRGMQTTYTIPPKTPDGGGFVAQPGTGQEFLTPMRAGQEFNRAQGGVETAAADARGITDPTIAARRGVFRPEGATGHEIQAQAVGEQQRLTQSAENKRPELVAQAAAQDTAQKKAQAKQHVTDFQSWLTQSPYATFKDGKLEYKSKDEHMERDRIAAESIAQEQGPKAGQQHFEDRQNIRRWLTTQALPSGFDANVYLNELSKNPALWQQLATQAGQLPPAQAPRPWYRMGPAQGQQETTPSTGFVAP